MAKVLVFTIGIVTGIDLYAKPNSVSIYEKISVYSPPRPERLGIDSNY